MDPSDELDDAISGVGDSPFAPAEAPPIRIIHLMLWTFCSALYLALMRVSLATQEYPEEMVAMQRTHTAIYGVIIGAAWAGAIILIHTRIRRGAPLLRHPGHWLLLITAGMMATWIPLRILLSWFDELVGFRPLTFLILCAIFVSIACANAYAAWCNTEIRWKILFVALTALNILQGLVYVILWSSSFWIYQMVSSVTSCANLLIPAYIVVVSIVDLIAHQRRDWLHWTGIVAQLATAGVALCQMILRWLTP